MAGLIAVGCGALGAFIGWFAGLALCPDWGDLGINAGVWAAGGAVIGCGIGVFVGAEIAG